MTSDPIENFEKASLDPYTSWQDIRTALAHQDTKTIVDACHRLKAHLRSLFNPEDPNSELQGQIIIEYLKNEPDLTQIWSIFQFTLSFRNLYPLVMDILGLFLSIPIPYQVHRHPLFLHLLKNFKPTLLSRLQNLNQISATVSTLRTLTLGIQAGFLQEFFEYDFFIPFPKLAGSILAQLAKKKKKKNVTSEKRQKLQPLNVRHFYVQYISALIKSSDSKQRQLIIDNADFLRPLLRNLEFDKIETLKPFFSALEQLLSDKELTRTSKVSLFTIVVLEDIRKLYNDPEKKQLADNLLRVVCTVPGQILCFKDYGIYPPPSYSLCNKQLSIFIFKLNVFDPLQQELLVSILKSCPELARIYSEKTTLSLDPKSSQRWITTVQFALKLLDLPFPSFEDPKVKSVYPGRPPMLFTVLSHIAPLSSFNRDVFARGYSMASPVILFFTARLMISVLENVKKALTKIDKVILWWDKKDSEETHAWKLLRVELLTETAKQMVNFQIILKCIHTILEHLPEDRFPPQFISSSSSNKSSLNIDDESILAMESDVQPSMIYLCMLRILSYYAELFPEHISMFDTGKLLANLPPISIMGEFLNTLIQWPPLLNSKSLSSLLRLHASKSYLEQTTHILEKLLSRSPLFAPCPQEVQWWLLDFPQNIEFLIFITNLFGESTQHLPSLQNTLSSCIKNHEAQPNFSCFAVALVQKLCKKGVDSFSPSFLSSCFAILQRIRASQVSSEAFDVLLNYFDSPLYLPEDISQPMHPFLTASCILQTVSKASGDKLKTIFQNLDHVLESTPLDASSLARLFSYPQVKFSISSIPQQICDLLMKYLTPCISNNEIKHILDEFLSYFQRYFEDIKIDSHCFALAAFSGHFQYSLSLDLSLFSLEQAIHLAPYVVHLSPAFFLKCMEETSLSFKGHRFIFEALLSQYPLLNCNVSGSKHKLSIDQIPESYLLQLFSLDPTSDPIISDLLLLILMYSKNLYLKALEFLESSSTHAIYFKQLVFASVVVLDRDSKLHWLNHSKKSQVLSLATRYLYLLAESPTLELNVALVLLEAAFENHVSVPPSYPANLEYDCLVRSWYTCITDESKSNFFRCVFKLLAENDSENTQLSMPSASFLLQIASSFTLSVDHFSNFGVQLLLQLVQWNTITSIRLLLKFLPGFISCHTTGQVQIVLQTLFEAFDAHDDIRLFYLQAITLILTSEPEKLCKQDYFFNLRSKYQATLHPCDLIIYDLFMLFEQKASTNLGPHLLFWGSAANEHTNIIDASFTLIDASLMYTTIQHFPKALCLNSSYFEFLSTCPELLSSRLPKDIVKFPYDPRFFLFLAIKYLEQGNSIDLQVLIDKHLVGLAIVSLCSEDPLMRHLGLRVLEEFYSLLDTSNLHSDSSLYLLFDYLKFSIQVRAPEPTKLPRLLMTFLAFALPVIQSPKHALYETLHGYLLSQPALDTEQFPLLRNVLSKSGMEGRTWMLSLFMGCTDEPMIRLSAWDWLIGYTDHSTLVLEHHLRCFHILLQWSMQVSMENFFTSGVLPYFHHIAYTSSHPQCLLALARGLAILYPRVEKQLMQKQFQFLSQALVHRCQSLSANNEKPWTLSFFLNMADALVRIDHNDYIQKWTASLISEVPMVCSSDPDDLDMDWFNCFHIATHYSFATLSILEHECTRMHRLLRSCVRHLAPFSTFCHQFAISYLKDPEFLINVPKYL